MLLATPVAQFPKLFREVAPVLGPKALVTDAGSTKRDVVAAARAALGRKISQFVPAHPDRRRGEERRRRRERGALPRPARRPHAARRELRVDGEEGAGGLGRACGARVTRMNAEEHDAIFAAVSHLPHVLAFALVHELATRENGAQLFGYAAGGFRDFTRIAGSSPEMWRDICIANRDALLEELRRYRKKLDALGKLLEAGDGAALERVFAEAARCALKSMDSLELAPVRRAAGTVRLPGSKSISNRMLLLAALAEGETEIATCSTPTTRGSCSRRCARSGVRSTKAQTVRVAARAAPSRSRTPSSSSATPAPRSGRSRRRSRSAAATTGSPAWRACTSGRSAISSTRCAASARASITSDSPAIRRLRVHAGTHRAASSVRVRGDVSSQFLTALLMALPLAGKPARIEVEGELISKPYVEITLNVMRRFGVRRAARRLEPGSTSRHRRYRSPGEILVEGDASSASYFLAAGALGGGPVRVEGVGRDSIQGDVRFTEVLERMGARVSIGRELDRGARTRSGDCRAFDVDLNHIPDAAMTAAVLALFADGPSTLAQHRELAREGDRPHRGDGDGAAQARRHGGGGRGFPAHHAARATRTPASRSTPTTITAWRCASRSPRSAACRCDQRPGLRAPRPSRTTSRRSRSHHGR